MVVGLGLGVGLFGSARAFAESCPIGQNQSCWEARAACEQRRAEAAAAKAAGLEQQLKDTPPVMRDTVLFKTDSAQPVEEKSELSDIASTVKRTPSAHVRIEGYADSRGSFDYNHALSLRRAEAVKQQLVGQGVNKDQVDTVPLGESSPQADNGTAEGRQLNRRAEIIIDTQGKMGLGGAAGGGQSMAPGGVGAGVSAGQGGAGAGVNVGGTGAGVNAGQGGAGAGVNVSGTGVGAGVNTGAGTGSTVYPSNEPVAPAPQPGP
jgi:outer membrane protein OmpA-like peptidoglycan-associated protein